MVGLRWREHVPAERPRRQVGELQARRVGPLVGKHQLKAGELAPAVGAAEDPPERELKLRVLPPAPPLDDDVREPATLPLLLKEGSVSGRASQYRLC